MGKKDKAHRAKVARRNRAIEHMADMLELKMAILQGVRERGFASIDEALEKAPEIFSEIFPGLTPDQIRKALDF